MSQAFSLGIGTALNNLTLILLILHVLGAYHLSSKKMVRDKAETTWRGFGKHLAVLFLLASPGFIFQALRQLMLLLTLVHIALDLLGIAINHMLERKIVNMERRLFWRRMCYLFDQLAHLAVIIGASQLSRVPLPPLVKQLNHEALLLAFFFVLITKPANVSFKVFFSRFADGVSPTLVPPVSGAGAIIGTMERIITALLLLVNQYAAIGLIFTAKSIARYDGIAKSQKFAEYYLIGSFFSILWVTVLYVILFS